METRARWTLKVGQVGRQEHQGQGMARFSVGFDFKTTHNSPPPVKVEGEGGRRKNTKIIYNQETWARKGQNN